MFMSELCKAAFMLGTVISFLCKHSCNATLVLDKVTPSKQHEVHSVLLLRVYAAFYFFAKSVASSMINLCSRTQIWLS